MAQIPEENITRDAQLNIRAKAEDKPVYEAVKRVLDVIFAVIALVILLVPFAIISLIIVIDSPGASPIYVQKRVGKDGKEFNFYKFRSMVPDAEAMLDSLLEHNEMDGPAFKMQNDPRITRFGKFIRRACIDELPQLINIIKGEMSFVGPRPPLPREVALYNDYQMQRLCVKPGLTCFWQVTPRRNDVSFDDWMKCDLRYIEERSLITDISIFFKTFGVVLGLEGR